MKQLLRHTSPLLRTALLLAALALIYIPTKAQTAGLPDAFETMDPASIIGDGNYYYIQFYGDGSIRCYLTDCGVNQKVLPKDFLPYANNRLWTLESAGDGDAKHFYLKSKNGHYIKFGISNRVGCVASVIEASVLTFGNPLVGDGYDISTAAADNYPMYRNGSEWAELPYGSTRRGANADNSRLRFVKLKSNSAFLIYYRGEGVDNSNSNAEATRHYLTYSGT